MSRALVSSLILYFQSVTSADHISDVKVELAAFLTGIPNEMFEEFRTLIFFI